MKNFSNFISLDDEIKVSLQIQILNCEMFWMILWLTKSLFVTTFYGHEIEICPVKWIKQEIAALFYLPV